MSRFINRAVAYALALACAIGIAQAQEPPAATSLVKAEAAPVSVRAGESATVTVRVTIAAGWHVYSNPPSLEYNIPTKVSLGGEPGLTPGKTGYPAGRSVKLASEEAAMSVYDGAIEVTVPLAATALTS